MAAKLHEPAERLNRFSFDGWQFSAAAVAASPFKPVSALHLGSFGIETPAWVREIAKTTLDRPECNQYSPSNGRKSLRDALAKTYSPWLGWDIDSDKEIVVTTGAIEGILSAIHAFVHPGDEVLIFEPFYDQFVNNVKFVGGVVKLVPLVPPKPHEKNGLAVPAKDWLVDTNALEATVSPKTRMLIMNSPHNPLGKVFSHTELASIATICKKHNIIIVSDEVYEHLSYTPTPFPRLAPLAPELTLTVGSAGKAFFLTGWRIGWVIGPAELIKQVTRAHIAVCFSTVTPFQEAVALALERREECEWFWARTRGEMEVRGKEFNQIWGELGLKYIEPEGGYFVIVDMSPLRIPKDQNLPEQWRDAPFDCHVAWFLTTVIGVAAVPCSTFTSKGYDGLPPSAVRFGFGRGDEELSLAKERLRSLKQYLVEDSNGVV